MTLLAIDTSEQACSVALLEGGAVVASASEHIGRGHAERLLPLIRRAIEPGRKIICKPEPDFGCYWAQAPSLVCALVFLSRAVWPYKRTCPVLVLRAFWYLPRKRCRRKGEDTVIHSLITGRGGQAFFQSFKGQDKDGTPKPVSDVAGLDIDDIATEISALGGSVIGSGVDLLIEAGHQDTLKAEGVSFNADRVISPMTLARLSAQLDPDAYPPEPTYFRAADAKKAKPALPTADRP